MCQHNILWYRRFIYLARLSAKKSVYAHDIYDSLFFYYELLKQFSCQHLTLLFPLFYKLQQN